MSEPTPLDGVVVIDESEGPVAGLATMVLADFGARVIKLEGRTGDRYRGMPSAPLWLRGKHSVLLDDDPGRAQAQRSALARQADVWVRGPHPPGDVDDTALRALNPRLVIGWVSAFGRRGPFAGYAPYEAVVAARVGRMLQFRGIPARPGPVYSALQVATHATSQALLAGVLAGLIARDRDGQGLTVEASLARGLLAYEMNSVLFPQVNAWLRERGQPEMPLPPDPATAMPTLNYHPLRTRDGRWLQMGNLLPHLFENFVKAIGLWDEYRALGVTGQPDLWPESVREAFRDRLFERLAEKDLDEWQSLFVADGGVASHPYQTTQQALEDPDAVANGHVMALGERGRQLGLLARLTRTPGQVGASAPAIGEHTERVLGAGAEPAAPAASSPPAAPAVHTGRALPLAGVTVVEAATIIAAPFAAAMLADMGARVIKLEPIDGDPFRTMPPGLGAARVNTGKQSIALDLKHPRAQAIAQALAARADIFIHNYRPGVPERLGIGYAQLSAVRPELVYLSANGYGPAGPGALRPSTHPIPGAAMGGVLHQIGGEPDRAPQTLAQCRETARRLMRANEVNPDPNTSLVIASAALLGLRARQRLGVGQAIFVDMFGANAYANWDDALSHPGKAARVSPDREGHGLDPLWRLYPCASGWVFLGIADETEWSILRQRLGDQAGQLPADDAATARAGGNATVEALGRLFAQADAATWEARLAPHGVGCVQADAGLPDQFFLRSAAGIADELTLPASDRDWGAYRRHGTLQRFPECEAAAPGTSRLGDHTDPLLRELGLSADEIVALRAARAVA